MPHVVVKLASGRAEALKQRLADRIVEDIVAILQCGEEEVSVAMVDVDPSSWMVAVYEPEIKGKWETLCKKPGYGPQGQGDMA